MGGNYSNQNSGSFLMPWDVTSSGTEGNVDVPVSSGTASKMILRLPAALGATETATLTLRKNGADTLLTCTIPGSGTSCSDTTDTVTFADGDLLSIRYNETNAPNARVKYSILYQAP